MDALRPALSPRRIINMRWIRRRRRPHLRHLRSIIPPINMPLPRGVLITEAEAAKGHRSAMKANSGAPSIRRRSRRAANRMEGGSGSLGGPARTRRSQRCLVSMISIDLRTWLFFNQEAPADLWFSSAFSPLPDPVWPCRTAVAIPWKEGR